MRCALVRHGQAELPVDLPGESGGGEDGGGGGGEDGGSDGGGVDGDGGVEASEPPQSSAKSVAAILPCVPILRIVSAGVCKSRDWAAIAATQNSAVGRRRVLLRGLLVRGIASSGRPRGSLTTSHAGPAAPVPRSTHRAPVPTPWQVRLTGS